MTGESNVKWIRDAEGPGPQEPIPDVVEICHELLERAKTGDVQGVICVAVNNNQDPEFWHVGRFVAGWQTIGCLQVLLTKLTLRSIEITPKLFVGDRVDPLDDEDPDDAG